MAKRTPAEVYQALIGAGWPPQAALTMTAIAGGESGWRDDALGDVRLQDATWGPSYGLFQIRTLKRETGKGTSRDLNALTGDVAAQARAAWEISKHGTDFSPWTVWRTGRYKDFLGQVSAAVGTVAGAIADVPGDLVAGALGGFRSVALEAAAVVLGLALIAVGIGAAVAPRLTRKVGQAVRLVT